MASLPPNNGPAVTGRRVLVISVPGGPPNSGLLPAKTPLPKKIDTAKRRIRWVNTRINQLQQRQSIREAYDDTLFRHITKERRSFSANRPPTEKDQTYFGAIESLMSINRQRNRTEDRFLKYLGKEKKQELGRLERANYRRQAGLNLASSKRIMRSDRRIQLIIGKKCCSACCPKR